MQRIRILKAILAPLIIAGTVVAFIAYIKHHPQAIHQLRQLSPLAAVSLLGLYGLSFGAYVWITQVSLGLYHKTLGAQEQFLFNAYSSLINFFGPGQSGPIFRGAYLKKRHNLGLKQFAFTVVLYLVFLAIISTLFAALGSRPWWQAIVFVLAVATLGWVVVQKYQQRVAVHFGNEQLANLAWLFVAVALQVSLLTVIYGVELRAVGAQVSTGQVLAYTGISNFSLFVAITPGAIGIREAFLVFSQNLHHIGSSTIVAANLVDRGVYLLFLGILFVLVLSLHAKRKLELHK